MTYNEAETRFFLIDPALCEKGYDDYQWLKLETSARCNLQVLQEGGVETAAGPIPSFGEISVQTIAVGFCYFRNIKIITA